MSPAAGAAQLEIEVKKTVEEINAAAISRGDRALNVMRNSALTVLSKDGSGRAYKRGDGVHIASAPGETPAPDLGNLRKDWQQRKLAGSNGGGVRIRLQIRSEHFYANYLEFGTRKMAPRKFRDKIRDHAMPQIATLFSNL